MRETRPSASTAEPRVEPVERAAGFDADETIPDRSKPLAAASVAGGA